MAPSRERLVALTLAAACAAWIAAAFARTERVAAALDAEPDHVRALALRDVGSMVDLLVARNPRPAILRRVLFELADTATLGRGRPRLAATTLGFAALGVVGLLPGRRRSGSSS